MPTPSEALAWAENIVHSLAPPIPYKLGPGGDGWDAPTLWLTYDDGSGAGWHASPEESEPEAVVRLADMLQESLVEETRGTPLPPCPGHRHPPKAELVNGEPSWVCPNDPARPIAPIAYR